MARRWIIALAIVVAVLVVGGGAGVATGLIPSLMHAAPSPAVSVTSQSDSKPAATPTSTPAAFNLPCDQQFDVATLAAVGPGLQLQQGVTLEPPTGRGITAAALQLNTNSAPPTAASDIAAAQSGLYECDWWNGTGAVTAVSLAVLPNGARLLPSIKTSLPSFSDDTLQQLPAFTVGDDSVSDCEQNDSFVGCEVIFTRGDLLFSIQIYPATTPPTPQQYVTDLTSLGQSVITSIAATGTRPSAVPVAASRWTGASDCASIQSALQPLYPGATFTFGQLDATDSHTPLFGEALKVSGGFACLGSGSATTVFVVPGAAAWAWDAPYAQAVTVTQLSTAQTPGLEAARFADEAGSGWADGVIDGAIVTVSADDAQTGLKALAAIAAG